MFYVVQNITSALKPLERKAVDSRLGKKSKHANKTEHNSPETIDDRDTVSDDDFGEYSILSIKSILLFLEDFLELHLSSILPDESHQGEQLSFAPWLSKQRSNDFNVDPRSNGAAKAYAHAAKTIGKPLQQKSGQQKQVMPEKVKNVYALIRDLRNLQDNGIGYLKINSQKTFLDGIYLAVQGLKPSQD